MLRITGRRVRLLDADNFAGGTKQLTDCIRRAGLIPDDDPESVELQFAQEKVRDHTQEGTLVEITPNPIRVDP